MTSLTASAAKPGISTIKRKTNREELPSTTITVMRRCALGMALVLWTVAAFAGEQYNNKQLNALKCYPYSTQAYSKSSLHTFGACRKL